MPAASTSRWVTKRRPINPVAKTPRAFKNSSSAGPRLCGRGCGKGLCSCRNNSICCYTVDQGLAGKSSGIGGRGFSRGEANDGSNGLSVFHQGFDK